MKMDGKLYIRLIGALNRAFSALRVLNCSCQKTQWPVFSKYCKIIDGEEFVSDVVLASFDWEGYRQRLDVAVTIEKYKETIRECNIANDNYDKFIEDMVGRDGERIKEDLRCALSEFGRKIMDPKKTFLDASYCTTWWHFCASRHCILDGRCMFFIAEDLLPILLISDLDAESFIGRKLKDIKSTFKETLIPFLVKNYDVDAGGWMSYFDPCIAQFNHSKLPDKHLGEVNIEISAAILTYLVRSHSIVRFSESISKTIDEIVISWLNNIDNCKIDGDDSLFFSWYTHPTENEISIKDETISVTIGIGFSLLSLLSHNDDGIFSSETVGRMQEKLKEIYTFLKQKTEELSRAKPLYCWSSGRDSYLANIPVTDIKPTILLMEFFLELLSVSTGKLYEYSEAKKIEALVSKLAELLISASLVSGLWPVLNDKRGYLSNPLFSQFSPKEWLVGMKANLSLDNSVKALSVLVRYFDRQRIHWGETLGQQIRENEYLIICIDLIDSTKYKHRVPSIDYWDPIEYQLTWMREWLDNYSPAYLNFTGDGFLALVRAEEAAIEAMTGNSELSIRYLVSRLSELREQHLNQKVFNRRIVGRTRAAHDELIRDIKSYENILSVRVSLHINVDKLLKLGDQYIGPDLDLCCRLNNPKLVGADSGELQLRPNPVFVSGLLVGEKSQFKSTTKYLGDMEAKGIEPPAAEGADGQYRFRAVHLYT